MKIDSVDRNAPIQLSVEEQAAVVGGNATDTLLGAAVSLVFTYLYDSAGGAKGINKDINEASNAASQAAHAAATSFANGAQLYAMANAY